ncbi:hypothetical protein [Gordonia sp. NB41Y]|uniref:hypothetical protein n=1 Tax=Gordonia sp. NB41Y TaxID=875808 RepID=UPI0006B22578|nr:hypothetical protein [Gordonia sp. NB41Y]KOY49361.1 hypothetical protein ISGA_10750 [Gordonia sp. NB41Y]WLP90508.1 hypothetical protein Q9K23_23920 [Gordonia sp. NB41Y]
MTTASGPPDDAQIRRQREDLQASLTQIGTGIVAALQAPRKPKRDNSTMSLWLLGLLPVAMACLHLVIVSRGDAETLRSLTENLNVTALVLATTLPLLSTALTWVFLLILLLFMAPKAQKRPKTTTLLVWLVIVGVIDFFAMSLRYMLVNAIIFAVLVMFLVVVVYWATQLKAPWGERIKALAEKAAKALGIAFLVAPLIVWLGFLGVWLPQEHLTVGETQLAPVYLLSSDVRWTKFMDADHKVHLIPTQSITRRQMLGTPQSTWSKTPFALIRGNDAPKPPNPPVPPAVTTTVIQPPPTPAPQPTPTG